MDSLRLRRAVYLVHRWTGVAGCVLMALWFASGIVMLFVGYPKLTPWERLGHLPALNAQACCVPVARALAASADAAAVGGIVLTTVRARPAYRLHEGDGRYTVVDAATGHRLAPASPREAVEAARAWLPGARADYLGTIREDRWTHSGALDPHRPLHKVQMRDPDRTLLYVSSATGEVVMDAPRAQRLWNYAGAWLHWLYLFRDRPSDPAWSGIVIALSAAGTVLAATGTLAGLWRWRFRGRYRSGSRSPYRDGWLRGHHIVGLAFSLATCAWIFSGLMSMNPGGMFDPAGGRPDLAAYRGGSPARLRPPFEAPQALHALREQGFGPRELEWRVLAGRPYLLARDGADRTRLVAARSGGTPLPGYRAACARVAVATRWPDARLREAAARLLSAPVAGSRSLDRYDAYYYGREPEAMLGARERRLPVLRVRFADAGRTWVYLDPYTGDVALSQDRRQRAGRWLFNFLHSWDLPGMLRAGWAREAVLVLLSLGGLALSLTGVVIGYARLRMKLSKARRAAVAQRLRQSALE